MERSDLRRGGVLHVAGLRRHALPVVVDAPPPSLGPLPGDPGGGLHDLRRGADPRRAGADHPVSEETANAWSEDRLFSSKKQDWRTRTHFVAIAALSMRQILIERARARAAQKRGGERARVTLEEGLIATEDNSVDLLVVDDALTRLAAIDPRQARLVELRFFGGLTVDEAAEALHVSPATVKRDWTVAKAWLQREITKGSP